MWKMSRTITVYWIYKYGFPHERDVSEHVNIAPTPAFSILNTIRMNLFKSIEMSWRDL
jgi:hypothetical protein